MGVFENRVLRVADPKRDEVTGEWGRIYILYLFIYCNWVVTRWQWLFYMYTKHEIGY